MKPSQIHAILEGAHPSWGQIVPNLVMASIWVSALVVTFGTVETVRDQFKITLITAEIALLIVFTIEYCIRVYSAPNRLKYILSFWGVVDLLACVPAILLLSPNLQSLRVLRLLRLIRLLKLMRLERAFDRITAAFEEVKHEMAVVVMITTLMLFLTSVGIYYFEHPAQPDAFSSIPAAMWWSIATLTTVGYGDIYPITAGGRIFTAFILLIGLGIVALPASLVTAALMKDK